MNGDIVPETLAQLEHDFEAHLVRGTHEYAAAWLALNEIRDTEAWRGSLLSDGEVPQTFDEYVRDLVGRVRDRNPQLPISRATVFYNLKWLRRSVALGIEPQQVLNAPPSVMNELSHLAEWDSSTGHVRRLKEMVNVDALPGSGEPVDRFSELVRDVVHSTPIDARHLVKQIRRDYDDEFTYTVNVHEHLALRFISILRCQWTRRVDGDVVSSTWHDLLRDKNLPEEIASDFRKRLT